MSREQFEENCQGCQPALIDVATGKPLADDTPTMQAVNRVWASCSRAEKETFHRVCCLNSRDPADLAVMGMLNRKIEAAARAAGN